MKMKDIYISLLAFTAMGAASCRKYVEVKQPNQREFIYVADFQRLLNNVSVFEVTSSLPLLSADDVEIGPNPNMERLLTNELKNIYTWAAEYYTSDQSDAGWDQLYKQVYTCNQVTANVMASDGTDALKRSAYAEAQMQRAATYLTLVNLYARPYNPATAATDPGLPLLLSPDLFVPLNRASVKQVYDQILLDINQALPLLPQVPSNNLHPGKAAGYALLARTYLYMGQFAEAADNAAKALAVQNTLLDLNEYVSGGKSYPRRLDNPEVIMNKKVSKPGTVTLPLSAELLNKFTPEDLRYALFTKDGSTFQPSFTGRGSFRDRMFANDGILAGLSVPETMLTAAEGLARTGKTADAMTLVNNLRKKRLATGKYVALTASGADEALRIVIDERRRELIGTGLRWFDQRRLSLESNMAETETRVFGGVTNTLQPGDRYVYPIPPKNIELNPELTQNQR